VAVLQIGTALNLPDLDTVMHDQLVELREAIEAEELRVAELASRAAAGLATPEDHAELAAIMARRGLWGDAAELLRGAPASADNDEWLAYLLFQDGRYREAHEIYTRLAGGGERDDLLLNAGVALALLGSDQRAARQFGAILETDPGHRLARLYLANAQLRLGRADVAAKNYRAYLDVDPSSEPAERVRRILEQIAPELVPEGLDEPLVPGPRPAPPPDADERETDS
jgi:tetratricopeptide (TPR) repeat protein